MKKTIATFELVIVAVLAVLGVRAYGLLAWAGEVEPVEFATAEGDPGPDQPFAGRVRGGQAGGQATGNLAGGAVAALAGRRAA